MTKYLVTPSALEVEADNPHDAATKAYLALASGPADRQTVLVWNPALVDVGTRTTYASTRWTLAPNPVDVTPKPVVTVTAAKPAARLTPECEWAPTVVEADQAPTEMDIPA